MCVPNPHVFPWTLTTARWYVGLTHLTTTRRTNVTAKGHSAGVCDHPAADVSDHGRKALTVKFNTASFASSWASWSHITELEAR